MTIPVNTTTGIEAMGTMSNIGLNAARTANAAADTELKYADLQMKFQDIAKRDMEIEVLQQEQDGKLAEAQISSERATSLFSELGNMKRHDAFKVQADMTQQYNNLQDQQRLMIGRWADVVNDKQSHDQAFGSVAKSLQDMGLDMTPQDFGIYPEWDGEATKGAWKIAQKLATSSQKTMEAERLNIQKFGQMMERVELLHEQDLQKQTRQFIWDSLRDDARFQKDIELGRLKAAKGTVLPRAQVGELTPTQLTQSVGSNIESIYQLADISYEPGDKEAGEASEIGLMASKLTKEIRKRSDEAYFRYVNSNGAIPYPGQAAIEEDVMTEFVGTIGRDGRIFWDQPNSKILEKQKFQWQQEVAYSPGFRATVDRHNLSPGEGTALLELMWQDPQDRWGEKEWTSESAMELPVGVQEQGAR